MNRKKQIEEMVAIIHHSDKNYNNIFPSSLNECLYKHGGVRTNAGIALYNAGYRRATEVAEEIFAEIGKRFEALLKMYPYGGELTSAKKFLAVHWELISKSIMRDYGAELKKKYTEGGE